MSVYGIIGGLIIFLLGYIIGKQQGWKQGYNTAAAVVPLEMRQQSFEKGECIICRELWREPRKYEISSRELDTL